MSLASCTCRRLTYVGGTSNKYYEVYKFANRTVTHYGAIGNTGKYNSTAHTTERIAQNEATKIVDSKLSKGYTVQEITQFDVELDEFTDVLAKKGDQGAGEWLYQLKGTARMAGSSSASPAPAAARPATPPKPEPPKEDRLAKLVTQSKELITTAAEDPIAASREYANLSERREELERELRLVTTYLSTVEAMVFQKA